jgi:WhiB family transcriptional regulator, redox-sensing transcriptional regulator
VNRSDWAAQAACLDEDPDLFFPPGERGAAIAQYELARSVCNPCPVRRSCLEFALEVDAQHGMWGGMAPDERKRVGRRLANSARPQNEDRARPRDVESPSPFGTFASFGSSTAFLIRSRKPGSTRG